jgi:atypical dual specificity phosphatase
MTKEKPLLSSVTLPSQRDYGPHVSHQPLASESVSRWPSWMGWPSRHQRPYVSPPPPNCAANATIGTITTATLNQPSSSSPPRVWPYTPPPNEKKNATSTPHSSVWKVLLSALPPHRVALSHCLRAGLTLTVALYLLNQNHCLPRPLSGWVSRVLFYPTLPITVLRRVGTSWETVIDDTVLLGGVPLWGRLQALHRDHDVRAVVNLCQEYAGPSLEFYRRVGIDRVLYLPTTDHFEPSITDLERAVSFIADCQAQNQRVYVHCRAGHGRSAAIVLCWLWFQQHQHRQQQESIKATSPLQQLQQLNHELCRLRLVRRTLWKQPNIQQYCLNRRGDTSEDTAGIYNGNEL